VHVNIYKCNIIKERGAIVQRILLSLRLKRSRNPSSIVIGTLTDDVEGGLTRKTRELPPGEILVPRTGPKIESESRIDPGEKESIICS
jgi:hypothetical protein